jgi:FkbM family methyltransferase
MNTAKHQDLVYDVGMHRGEDTGFYLSKGFRVIAFEANPDLAQSCRKRFAEFIAQGKLIIVEGSIVDSSLLAPGQTKIQFYKDSTFSFWGTVSKNWVDRNTQLGSTCTTIEVDVVDFQSVLRTHGVPRYIKIDIEGCDLVCLEALKAFPIRPDFVSIESDKTSLSNVRHEIELLTGLGYTSFQVVEQSAIPMVVPPNPASEGNYAAHQFEEGASGLFGSELPGKWLTSQEVLRLYKVIRWGYILLGDDGLMRKWRFRGAGRLRFWTRDLLQLFTKAAVPGWYDTHARHSSAIVNSTPSSR